MKRAPTIFAKKLFRDKPISVAEIGVQAGINAEEMNQNLNIKALYLIDPWIPYTQLVKGSNLVHHDFSDAFELVKRKFKNCKNVHIMKGLSLEEVKKIEDNSLDYIYLDGDHNYEGIKADIGAWEPKLKTGGLMAGHDYSKVNWPGVVKAVDDWVKNKNIELHTQRVEWWYVK